MKICPVCKARCFDDMEVCYGCMHRFDAEPQGGQPSAEQPLAERPLAEQSMAEQPAAKQPSEEQLVNELSEPPATPSVQTMSIPMLAQVPRIEGEPQPAPGANSATAVQGVQAPQAALGAQGFPQVHVVQQAQAAHAAATAPTPEVVAIPWRVAGSGPWPTAGGEQSLPGQALPPQALPTSAILPGYRLEINLVPIGSPDQPLLQHAQE